MHGEFRINESVLTLCSLDQFQGASLTIFQL